MSPRPHFPLAWLRPGVAPVMALTLVLGLGGAGMAQQQAPATAPAPAARPAAQPTLRGQVLAWRNPTLSSEIAARIAQVTMRDGQEFAAGAVLVVFDCGSYRARQASAQAHRDKAQRQAYSLGQLDRSGATSRLEVGMALADAAAAEAELELAKISVERCTIRAPFAGRVVETKAQAGQFVREGEPLMEILDHRNLEVEFLAPSAWLPWLRPGVPFEVRVDDLGHTVTAQVARLGARVDPVSQVIKVYAALPADAPGLMAGMSVGIAAPPRTGQP